ncbi:MAG: hypothetical protein GY765_05425 [bacterium]|nr:hypothetical protein [bacterium]
MIELWNVANRNIDVSFSVENSIVLLSQIAKTLMEENRREMELLEIRRLLPDEIEGCSREVFLKEMVLKAGLLYESEGVEEGVRKTALMMKKNNVSVDQITLYTGLSKEAIEALK